LVGIRRLISRQMVLLVWLPAALITLLHYVTGPELHWLHDVLRRLYYLPILLAAFALGLRGGLLVALVVAAAYSPHAFTHLAHQDPAHTLEKVLELLLYLVVGGVAGILVDRERRRAGELREALEEQRRTADQLVRAGRLAALGEMVAGIAHELKNPLHALRGTAEVVDGAVAADAPQRRLWELHKQEIDRLEHVAGRFLSFARPAAPERRELDLEQVVQKTCSLVEAQARKQNVSLSVVPGEGRAALADEQQLAQVLLNITLNALNAIGAAGGAVRYTLGSETRGERPYITLAVENDGPPIPEADLERIFDPFFSKDARGDGAGLGLSIASRIVEGHGGFIEARNKRIPEGRAGGQDGHGGVVFTVFLPAG
jgi:signal transduction histidine kinase